jgi:hypothetical protein
MRHYLYIALALKLALTVSVTISFAQDFRYPTIRSTGKTIPDFIPAGWTILDSAAGDLNKDGRTDAALVIQHQDSILLLNDLEDTALSQPRILLIVFREASGNSFFLVERSNSFILKHDNSAMDDPFKGISIAKGILELDFTLFYNMGSWYTSNSSYKFRYNGKMFQLIGADTYTIHRASLDFESFSYNFLTKKRIQTKGSEEKGTRKTNTKTLTLPSMMTFGTFKQPYTWEVEKDIFL